MGFPKLAGGKTSVPSKKSTTLLPPAIICALNETCISLNLISASDLTAPVAGSERTRLKPFGKVPESKTAEISLPVVERFKVVFIFPLTGKAAPSSALKPLTSRYSGIPLPLRVNSLIFNWHDGSSPAGGIFTSIAKRAITLLFLRS